MPGFSDPTIGHLRRLDPSIQLAAVQMVTHVRQTGVPLTVTSSRRSSTEQRALVRAGNSLTMQSKHLIGLAFDVDVYGFHRGEIPLWWFYQLGQLGEQLGFRWGGRWTGLRDYGHFEARA